MYKVLNKFIDLVLISIYDVAKLMAVLLLFFFLEEANISHLYISKIFFVAIVQYMVIYLLLLLIVSKSNNKKLKSIYIIFISILSFMIPLSISNMYGSLINVFSAVFFFLIAIKSILYSNSGVEVYTDLEKEKATLLMLVFVISIFVMVLIHVKQVVIQAIKTDFVIIIISKIIRISRLSFLEEYELGCSIKIGKDRNLLRMNLISMITILTTVFIANLRQVRFVVKVMYDGLAELYSIIGVFIISVLSNTFLHKIIFKYSQKRNAIIFEKIKEGKELDELRKKWNEEQLARNSNKSMNTTIFTIIAVILIIIAIILAIYYVTKKMKINIMKANISDQQIETKEFIFRDKNEGKSKRRHNLTIENKLNKIRRIYINLVYDLRRKGVKYDASFTPIEYCKVIDESGHGNEYTRYIIQLYNGNRYGNKTINKYELDKAYKLKNASKM